MRETKKLNRPLDRRIQRTRQLLFDALMNLILEKGYEAVTVQDIIDKANVGRSTFYAHFENKDQLLYGSHQELNQMLFSVQNTKEEIDFLTLYTHAQEHSHVAKAMLGKKGGELVIGYFRDAMAFKILNEMKKGAGDSKGEQKMLAFAAEAAAAALTRLLTCWLDHDMPFSAEEMAEKNCQMYASILGIKQSS